MKQYSREMMVRELEWVADDFLQEHYGLSLNIPIKINGRLITTLGQFKTRGRGDNAEAVDIAISKKLIEFNEWSQVVDVLKHELIHYALFEIGLPYRDGEGYFEDELKQHKTSSTHQLKTSRKRHVYTCECEGNEFIENRKDGHNYRCKECKATLKFKETIAPNQKVKIV